MSTSIFRPDRRNRFRGLDHLSEATLRDIGLEREDSMSAEVRRARTRLFAHTLF